MTSSIRLRNSSRKCCFRASWTFLLHLLVGHRLAGLGEADGRLAQVGGAEVGGHNDHRVLEVHDPPLNLSSGRLRNLQQSVEHFRMGLFDLVEQDDRERLTPDRFGELAALLVSDVAGRRTDEPAPRVLLRARTCRAGSGRPRRRTDPPRLRRLGLAPRPDGPPEVNDPLGRLGSLTQPGAADGLRDRPMTVTANDAPPACAPAARLPFAAAPAVSSSVSL